MNDIGKGMETPNSSTNTLIDSSGTFIKTESDDLDKSMDELLSEIMDEESQAKSNVISKSSRSKTKTDKKPHSLKPEPETENGLFEDNTFEDDFDVEVLSSIPSDFNADDHLFHMNLLRNVIEEIPGIQKKKNATFSKERMREIDVDNHFLLQRIMKHQTPPKSAGLKRASKPSNYFNQEYVENAGKRTSSAINRKKQQSKIDYENGILLKKLENIRKKRPRFP